MKLAQGGVCEPERVEQIGLHQHPKGGAVFLLGQERAQKPAVHRDLPVGDLAAADGGELCRDIGHHGAHRAHLARRVALRHALGHETIADIGLGDQRGRALRAKLQAQLPVLRPPGVTGAHPLIKAARRAGGTGAEKRRTAIADDIQRQHPVEVVPGRAAPERRAEDHVVQIEAEGIGKGEGRGGVRVQRGGRFLKKARVPDVVGVDEPDIARPRLFQPAIARPGKAAIVLPDHPYARVFGDVRGQHGGKIVGRAVVDDEDFDVLQGLVADREDRVADQPGEVIGGNHHRHARQRRAPFPSAGDRRAVHRSAADAWPHRGRIAPAFVINTSNRPFCKLEDRLRGPVAAISKPAEGKLKDELKRGGGGRAISRQWRAGLRLQ